MPRHRYSSVVREVRDVVADRVKRAMRENGVGAGEFAEAFCEELGFGNGLGAGRYLASVRVGKQYGATTEASRGFVFTEAELTRLPTLFNILGIDPSDSVVDEVRRVKPSFDYAGNEGNARPLRPLRNSRIL